MAGGVVKTPKTRSGRLTRWALLGAVIASVPLSFVGAPYPEELLLQHVPTVFGLAALIVVTARFHASWLSFGCCLAFIGLHIIGARWIYSFVPYDDWARSITGRSLSEVFGWRRNHYDRMVHFASGLIGLPPIVEALRKLGGVTFGLAVGLAVACVLAIGAAYEVLEWQIAMVFSPETAEAYNGQQGDVWDPQKDLALAGIGAIGAAVLFLVFRHSVDRCSTRWASRVETPPGPI